MNWNALFGLLNQTEENLIPLVIHNPSSQKITAVVLVAESAVEAILSQILPKPKPAPVTQQAAQ